MHHRRFFLRGVWATGQDKDIAAGICAHNDSASNDLRKRGSTPTCDGAFTCMIPAKSLTEISSDKSAHDAKYGSQNETTRLVVAGRNEFR